MAEERTRRGQRMAAWLRGQWAGATPGSPWDSRQGWWSSALLWPLLVGLLCFGGVGGALAEQRPVPAQAPASAAADQGHAQSPGLAPTGCPPPLPAETLAAPPRDRGLLWRIRRDGRSSYLFGTLHVGKPPWRQLGPRTLAALRASDVLAVELDPGDPAVIQALAAVPSPPPLPPALEQRLADARARACVAPEALSYLHPLLQASTLAVLEARWLGLDPAYALEHLLLAQARALQRRVVALESAQLQTGVLVPADETQARTLLEQSLQQLEDQSGRRVLQRLATAWEQGDLATLEDYATWCECVADAEDIAFLRRLNDDRNPALADGIDALHRRGRRVFAAVGALHMTGAMALPRLLAQRGFKVERVAFGR